MSSACAHARVLVRSSYPEVAPSPTGPGANIYTTETAYTLMIILSNISGKWLYGGIESSIILSYPYLTDKAFFKTFFTNF
jgi:hypothetical protein